MSSLYVFIYQRPKMTKKYFSLTPIALEKDEYYDALDWAIKDKKVTNIAVSGDYGSGKSSVVHSFVEHKNNEKSELKCLNISLATFNSGTSSEDENVNEEENSPPAPECALKDALTSKAVEESSSEESSSKEKILDLEQAVLKHMFYQLEPSETTGSRFKQISHTTKSQKVTETLVISIFSLFIYMYANPKALGPDLNAHIGQTWLAIFAFLGCAGLLYKVISLSASNTLKKLGIVKGEIEFSEKKSDSAFHQYLDEIIHFFEKTEYDLVVFEDLDRFEDAPAVFGGLREINQLLNKRKRINNKLKFIYVVKDDLFEGEERTKFFDYILPIIPIVSSANSKDMFFHLLNEAGLDEQEAEFKQLISDVSYGVSDVRLIKNIVNEYKIYSNKLKSEGQGDNKFELLPHKLLAIVIYKNLAPRDFTQLRINKGNLADVFNRKAEFITDAINELEQEIESLNAKIARCDNDVLKGEEELFAVLKAKVLEHADSYTTSSQQRTQLISLGQKAMENLSKASDHSLYKASTRTKYKISDAMEAINYWARKEALTQNSESLLHEIEGCKQRIDELTDVPTVEELCASEDGFTLINQAVKGFEIFDSLLRYGYISEDYAHYMSFFYGQGLNDQNFIKSVLYNQPKDFNFKLTSVANVVKELSQKSFNSQGILNIELFDYLCSSQHEKLTFFVASLIKWVRRLEPRSLDFFSDFILYNGRLERVTADFIAADPDFFAFFLEHRDTTSYHYLLFRQTFLSMELSQLDNENTQRAYLTFLEQKISLALPEIYRIAKRNLEDLTTRLNSINFKYSYEGVNLAEPELPGYIAKNGLFAVNIETLRWAIKTLDENLDWFETQSYSALIEFSQKHQAFKLIRKHHFAQYIAVTYQALEHLDEEPEVAIELLNDTALEAELKATILQRQKRPFRDLLAIEDETMWPVVFERFLIYASWHNILNFFSSIDRLSGPSKELTTYLSTESVYEALNKEQIGSKFIDVAKELLVQCTYSEQISAEVLEKLLVVALPAGELDILDIPEDKLETLIDLGYIELTSDNISELKRLYSEKFYHLKLVAKHIEEFLTSNDYFNLSVQELAKLLELLPNPNKSYIGKLFNKALNALNYDREESLVENGFADLIDQLFNLPYSLDVLGDDLDYLMKSDLNSDSKLKLFIAASDNLTEEKMCHLLPLISLEYKALTEPNKRPKISLTELNRVLLTKLEARKAILTSFAELSGKQFEVRIKKSFDHHP